jgi:Protein of unknown function (DUF559)
MGERAIDFAISHARLYPVFRSAYGVGHEPLGRQGRLMAAVLACGPGSVIAHGTAASLLGLWEKEPALIDVIAPVEIGRGFDGIRRRHTPMPAAWERGTCDGVPCTSPSRTIVDLAGMVGTQSLRDTIEQAAVLEILDIAGIDWILRGPRRRGSRHLRLVLTDWRRYPAKTKIRSRLEARLLRLLTQWDVPIPLVNSKLSVGDKRFELDFFWPEHRLVVETDGGKYHGNPFAQARDSNRNRILRGAGYEVRRLGWWDLEQRPAAVRTELRRLLARAARA